MTTKRILLGESGGPTPVIDWEVAGALDQAQKTGWEVYGMINGLQGLLNANIEGNIVDLTGVDPMSLAFNGPGAGLRTTRIKPNEDEYQKIGEQLEALGIDAVVYFGGNDTADQLHGLTKSIDVQAIHGIKTVDNDLPATHHCPGYGSAALFNATALKNVHSDYDSYRVKGNFNVNGTVEQGWAVAPVIIYQVMGRKAGWLAQGTGFSRVDPKGEVRPDRPPHLVLSYEVPFDKQAVMDELDDLLTRLGGAVIVVQEDLQDAETGQSLAEMYSENLERDEHGNIQHGRASSFSPAQHLARLCKEELDVDAVHGEVKDVALVPQHIQRSYMMSEVDASEAFQVGSACVKALEAHVTKKSIILERDGSSTNTGLTDMRNIAARVRPVPGKYINGLKGPRQEFIDEFIYLIGGPVALPHYSLPDFPGVEIPEIVRKNPYISDS